MEIVEKNKAEQLRKNSFALSKVENGMYITDLKNVYLASNKESHKEEYKTHDIWKNNQAWVLFETEKKLELPTWFDKDFATEVLENVSPKEGKVKARMGNLKKMRPGKEKRFYPESGTTWIAQFEKDAIWKAKSYWNPLDSIRVEDAKLIFDNGESKYTGKPIQLWDDETLVTMSTKERHGNLSEAKEVLLKHAIDQGNSPWRENKKWKQLLNFEGEISEFKCLGGIDTSGMFSRSGSSIYVAKAGKGSFGPKFILIREEWHHMGADGATGENLYLFEEGQYGFEAMASVGQIALNNLLTPEH